MPQYGGSVSVSLWTTDLQSSTTPKPWGCVGPDTTNHIKELDGKFGEADQINRLYEKVIPQGDGNDISRLQFLGPRKSTPFILVRASPVQLEGILSAASSRVSTENGGPPDPQAFGIAVKLDQSCFVKVPSNIKKMGGNKRDMDIKIDVLYNGSFEGTEYIPLRKRTSGYGLDGSIFFHGRRVDRSIEKPWVLVHATCGENGGVGGSHSAETDQARQRWQLINAKVKNHADSVKTPDGGLSLIGQYLKEVASMPLPEFQQGPGNAKFGVIDVVISVGRGKKDDPTQKYLLEPTADRINLLDIEYKNGQRIGTQTTKQHASNTNLSVNQSLSHHNVSMSTRSLSHTSELPLSHQYSSRAPGFGQGSAAARSHRGRAGRTAVHLPYLTKLAPGLDFNKILDLDKPLEGSGSLYSRNDGGSKMVTTSTLSPSSPASHSSAYTSPNSALAPTKRDKSMILPRMYKFSNQGVVSVDRKQTKPADSSARGSLTTFEQMSMIQRQARESVFQDTSNTKENAAPFTIPLRERTSMSSLKRSLSGFHAEQPGPSGATESPKRMRLAKKDSELTMGFDEGLREGRFDTGSEGNSAQLRQESPRLEDSRRPGAPQPPLLQPDTLSKDCILTYASKEVRQIPTERRGNFAEAAILLAVRYIVY